MSWIGPAAPGEFRWRIAIMLASLPAFAGLCDLCDWSSGPWYAPQTPLAGRLAAAAAAVCGGVWRVWGTAGLTAARMLAAEVDAERLLQTGPFSVVRNPLYLGTQLVIGGWSLLYGPWPALAFIGWQAWRFQRIVLLEEQELRVRWGNLFEAYASQVPRWRPRLIRRGLFDETRWTVGVFLTNAPLLAVVAALVVAAFSDSTLLVFPSLVLGIIVTQVFIAGHQRRRRTAARSAEASLPSESLRDPLSRPAGDNSSVQTQTASPPAPAELKSC